MTCWEDIHVLVSYEGLVRCLSCCDIFRFAHLILEVAMFAKKPKTFVTSGSGFVHVNHQEVAVEPGIRLSALPV